VVKIGFRAGSTIAVALLVGCGAKAAVSVPPSAAPTVRPATATSIPGTEATPFPTASVATADPTPEPTLGSNDPLSLDGIGALSANFTPPPGDRGTQPSTEGGTRVITYTYSTCDPTVTSGGCVDVTSGSMEATVALYLLPHDAIEVGHNTQGITGDGTGCENLQYRSALLARAFPGSSGDPKGLVDVELQSLFDTSADLSSDPYDPAQVDTAIVSLGVVGDLTAPC
jgi:hypothetical protein